LYRICKTALGQGRGYLPLGSGHGQQGQGTYREVRGHYRAGSNIDRTKGRLQNRTFGRLSQLPFEMPFFRPNFLEGWVAEKGISSNPEERGYLVVVVTLFVYIEKFYLYSKKNS